jgi:hypothetical protein
VGVAYDPSHARWGVFEEDHAIMPAGPSFNVLVGTRGTRARSALLKSTASNIELDYVRFKNRRTDNDFKAEIFATAVWNPGGTKSGSYLDSTIGVFYHNGAKRPFRWAVFREDQQTMTAKEGFNLLYYTG